MRRRFDEQPAIVIALVWMVVMAAAFIVASLLVYGEVRWSR